MTVEKKQYNWPQLGNETVIKFLESALFNNMISSTYIFSGLQDLGKFQVAKAFASNLIFSSKDGEEDRDVVAKNSGDLQILELEEDKKNISIKQVRELIKNLNLSSFLNSYKVAIIKDAHKLSIEAANALLKTLEEPENKVVIILLAEKIDNLPETIVSRSQILKFQPVKRELIYDYLLKYHQADREEAKKISSMSMGKPALAVKYLKDKDYYDKHLEQARLFVNFTLHDENYRLKELQTKYSKNLYGASGRNLAYELLDVWEAVARDLLLIENDQFDSISYLDLVDNLSSAKLSSLDIIKAIHRARKYLASNLNPKAVLEECVISF
ncbi:AAA family ATPase [Patescibacteria group bacterium]|nr:AAA family ATPase [Patescibacteria group bacterium]